MKTKFTVRLEADIAEQIKQLMEARSLSSAAAIAALIERGIQAENLTAQGREIARMIATARIENVELLAGLRGDLARLADEIKGISAALTKTKNMAFWVLQLAIEGRKTDHGNDRFKALYTKVNEKFDGFRADGKIVF